jgi:hypothetical protein
MSLAENYNSPTTFAGTPAYEISSSSAEYFMRRMKSKCGVLETGLYFGSIWPRISEF